MKSPSMTVSCIAGLITFVYLINVHANPLQDKCNKENPVLCPASRMCCRGYQFCYNKSNTCEDCFPVSERHDRLKFCSDIQKNRTTRTMRDNTCVGACIALFDITEIINYTDKDPVKTQAQLEYELLQEKMNRLNKTLDQRLKQEISNHNSSMHEHLEGSVVKRIEDNQRRVTSLEDEVSNLKLADDNQRSVTSLEDEVSNLKLAAILILVLTLIAIIIGVAFYGFWRRRVSKMKKQTDVRERKKLLDDDVEKKLNDAFDLSKDTSLFSRTWLTRETKFNEDVQKLTTQLDSQEKQLQDTKEIFTKNNDESKAELGRINALLQELESTINEKEKQMNVDLEKKLVDAFNLENEDSLFYKQWLPLQEKLNRAIDAYNTRVENQENLLHNIEEKIKAKIEELKTEVERRSDISQQSLQSQFDELQKSVTKECAKLTDNDLRTKIDDIHTQMKYFMRRIDDQEKLFLAENNQREIGKSVSSQHTKHKRSSSPIVEEDSVSLRRGNDVEISNGK